jgi:Zn-dependent protease
MADPMFWLYAVMNLIVFILSLTVHEYSHARVAFALGDDTAARLGRMTLNPISHIDLIGTILLPVIGSAGLPVIGWAKPVPVSPNRLTRKLTMRTGMALVSIAGPLSNLVLAFVCTAVFWLVFDSGFIPRFGDENLLQTLQGLLVRLIFANVGLALFNMLPIPPLDGHRLLPRSLDWLADLMARYSFIAFLLMIFVAPGLLAWPVSMILHGLFRVFGMNLDLWVRLSG